MRSILIAAALAAGPAIAADRTARSGDDWVRISDAECVNEEVLARVPPDLRAEFRKATAGIQGVRYEACWRQVANVVHIVYPDGDQGIVPDAELKEELGA